MSDIDLVTKNREEYIGQMIENMGKPQHRIMVGIPMTGLLRSEWVTARYGQVIPCNWSQVDTYQFLDQWSPTNYTVADARNIIATNAVDLEFEWLFFIDHDVILPQGTVLKLNQYCLQKNVPVLSGLYFTKSYPSEPLVYRGRGNSYFKDWVLGENIWVSAIPMGVTLIHVSILKALYDEVETYDVGAGKKVKRIFETPAKFFLDPENRMHTMVGTEDIKFCNDVITKNIFDKAGWPEYQEKEFPFLVDTSIFCRHIDWNGIQYPSRGEEIEYLPKDVVDGEGRKQQFVYKLKDKFNMRNDNDEK